MCRSNFEAKVILKNKHITVFDTAAKTVHMLEQRGKKSTKYERCT